MAFLFKRPKPDLVKNIKELLPRLKETPVSAKVEEDLVRLLNQTKLSLQGTQEIESSPEQVSHLVNSVIAEDLLYDLVRSVSRLPFETRKDAQAILSFVLRWKPSGSQGEPPAVAHVIDNRPEIVVELCKGYTQRESSMPCGIVLREALKHEAIAAIILYDESERDGRAARIDDIDYEAKQTGDGIFWNFITWIDGAAFEVSTDAFTTFKEILTRHKALVASYLSVNFELFFSRYNGILLASESYVTKRQSIKLLGEILLDRANYNVMTSYVDRGEHLKLCMILLKDTRKMVQYEAFHVFKVFVANPNKSVAVQRILINNRERLLGFLPGFLEDRTEDDQFTDEKSFLVRQIEVLPPSPIEPAARPVVA
ncbi:hypothetical protein MMC25_007496 [Agyrium rufum]|nr:hypothetical protein [Agyrium rufum]